ncbi:MAG: peptidoglycan-binding domain-containing protein [Candidatus Peregrinibacteria bacterium]
MNRSQNICTQGNHFSFLEARKCFYGETHDTPSVENCTPEKIKQESQLQCAALKNNIAENLSKESCLQTLTNPQECQIILHQILENPRAPLKGVLMLQRALQILGYNPGVPDGQYARRDGQESNTQRAIKAFQKANDLLPSIIPDQMTIAKIGEVLNGEPKKSPQLAKVMTTNPQNFNSADQSRLQHEIGITVSNGKMIFPRPFTRTETQNPDRVMVGSPSYIPNSTFTDQGPISITSGTSSQSFAAQKEFTLPADTKSVVLEPQKDSSSFELTITHTNGQKTRIDFQPVSIDDLLEGNQQRLLSQYKVQHSPNVLSFPNTNARYGNNDSTLASYPIPKDITAIDTTEKDGMLTITLHTPTNQETIRVRKVQPVATNKAENNPSNDYRDYEGDILKGKTR